MRLSKLHKAIISIQLAVLLILPVNADMNNQNDYFDLFPYFLVDNSGCIILSPMPLSLVALSDSANSNEWNYINYYPVNNPGESARYNAPLPFIILTPIYTYSDGEKLITDYSYQYYYYECINSSDGKWKVFNTTTYEWNTINNSQKYYTGGSGKNLFANCCLGFYYPNGANFVYVQTANYIVTPYTDSDILTLYTGNIYDSNLRLTDYLSKAISSEDVVYNIYNEVNNISQIVNDILNLGSGYPLPSGGVELESAQNALSEAEGAISDKSQSIKDQISSQVQSNLELAASSADKVKQDSVQIKQLYATVTSSLPDEVKLLFVVVPLLLFVGWLIGRVRQ